MEDKSARYNLNDVDFEKKYTVTIVKDPGAKDGYEFYVSGNVDKDERKSFELTYYYKKIKKLKNPVTIIDCIKGDDFKGRNKIISHFEMNYAIKYSVERDGFYNL